jgi:hypothetical protein
MKFFLVVVICVWGECQNFISTDPTFDSREACQEYSQQVANNLQQELPDSSGKTYCFNEEELESVTDELLNDWQKNQPDSAPSTESNWI